MRGENGPKYRPTGLKGLNYGAMASVATKHHRVDCGRFSDQKNAMSLDCFTVFLLILRE